VFARLKIRAALLNHHGAPIIIKKAAGAVTLKLNSQMVQKKKYGEIDAIVLLVLVIKMVNLVLNQAVHLSLKLIRIMFARLKIRVVLSNLHGVPITIKKATGAVMLKLNSQMVQKKKYGETVVIVHLAHVIKIVNLVLSQAAQLINATFAEINLLVRKLLQPPLHLSLRSSLLLFE